MLVCIETAGIAQPLPANLVLPPTTCGVAAAAVGAAPLLSCILLLLLLLLLRLPPVDLVNVAVAGPAHPLLASGRVAAPAHPLAVAWAVRAALQAPPLRRVCVHNALFPWLCWAPLQHGVWRQLAAMRVCMFAAGSTEPLPAGGVPPPEVTGEGAATVRPALLISLALLPLARHGLRAKAQPRAPPQLEAGAAVAAAERPSCGAALHTRPQLLLFTFSLKSQLQGGATGDPRGRRPLPVLAAQDDAGQQLSASQEPVNQQVSKARALEGWPTGRLAITQRSQRSLMATAPSIDMLLAHLITLLMLLRQGACNILAL